jgi:hypothetical protein
VRISKLTPLTAADFVKRDGIWIIRIRGANSASWGPSILTTRTPGCCMI